MNATTAEAGLGSACQSAIRTDQMEDREAPSNRLAALLRWLGTATVACSAVLFLLQGLDDVDGVLRNWGHLGLMALLAAAGVGVRAATGDARSARLLLALATALVPIQFAQLGGMLHSLLGGADSTLSEFFSYELVTWGLFTAVAVASLAVYTAVSRLGFAVLVRPDAGVLSALYLVPSALLLVPLRDGVPGFLLVGAMAGLAMLFDARLRNRSNRYRTREGLAVRAMLAAPLAIAAARYAFHVDSLAGGCAILGLLGVAVIHAGRHYVERERTREDLTAIGTGLSSLAWVIWTSLPFRDGDSLLVVAPLTAFLFLLGAGSSRGRAYRFIGSLLLAFATLDLLASASGGGSVLALLVGVITVGWGVLRQEREPTLAGAGMLLAALAVLSTDLVDLVHLEGWIALALGGVLLVVAAAFVERYGRSLVGRAQHGWTEVTGWS